MPAADFLACDWGTTRLRAWVLDERGNVLRHRKFALGVSKAPGQAAQKFKTEVRPAMEAEGLPAILCGMVGSTLGWTVVPYLQCPASLSDVAGGMLQVENGPPVWIVPGLRCHGIAGAPDVMRGEETQILGWIAADPRRATAGQIVCHPGTHSKWVVVDDGSIVQFLTAMTGELFGLLRKHSVLEAEGSSEDETSFYAGVQAAGDGNALAARLFTTRARVVTGEPLRSPASYLSGLLIGAEIASVPRTIGIDWSLPVTILGDPELSTWYERAMIRLGLKTSVSDGESAVIRGLTELRKRVHST